MIQLTKYRITLKHDKGKVRLIVISSTGIQGAILQVIAAECCPESAITQITKMPFPSTK